MTTTKTCLYATTHRADIAWRETHGEPLTRKQAKAKRQRAAQPPTASGYSAKRRVPAVVKWDMLGAMQDIQPCGCAIGSTVHNCLGREGQHIGFFLTWTDA